MRRPTLRLVLILGVLALVAFMAARASAFGRHKDMRARVGQQVKLALDAVKATPAQRSSVEAAVSEVLRTAEDAFGAGGMPDLDEILNLFARTRLDTHAVEALKSKRDARHKKIADALTQAFYEVHDALTAEQRLHLLDYAHGRASEGRHMRKFKQALIEGFVNAQVEDVLEQLAADAREREVVHGARDLVVTAIKSAQATKQASIEEISNLFRGDTVDKSAVARFRADKETQVRAIADAIERALTQVHDGLSAEHRQKLVELVRARRERGRTAAQHPTSDESF